jgi:hypothetical protein
MLKNNNRIDGGNMTSREFEELKSKIENAKADKIRYESKKEDILSTLKLNLM